MTDSTRVTTLARQLTSRRGAWAWLITILVLLTALFGGLGQVEAPNQGAGLAPAGAESTKVAELLEEFPDADSQSVLVVAEPSSSGQLTEDQLADLDALVTSLEPLAAGQVFAPFISDDDQIAMIVTPIKVANTNAETAETITELREHIAAQNLDSMNLYVTGGPAFGADIASAFDNADFTLLAVTILIVAVLLILTYRSPILWLIPLIVVAIADRVASMVTAALGNALELYFDAGIISVLVFGAGTNYALLLISRYREELTLHDDHRLALASAWRKATPTILASNLTTVLAVLTLDLAVIPGTRGLGVAAGAGLLIALLAILFLLPPVLAICTRKAFWPVIPKPGDTRVQGKMWQKVANTVMKKPALSLTAGLALLAVMATGLFGASVGLDQIEKFRVQSESATGLEVLSEHFAPGEAQPITVLAKSDHAAEVTQIAKATEGVVRANPIGTSVDGEWTNIMVTSEYAPDSDESMDQIRDLREAVHEVPEADALVGGAVATELDARDGSRQDLLMIAPLVLGILFVGLLVLLRSLVAPVLLLLVNTASAVAAIGAGAWLSTKIFDQSALDHQVPLLAFLFLVALGIDYTIFLILRAQSEASELGTRAGMALALSRTGNVITSAGIVLAGVFAALGLLPLVTLGQLGLIVGLGVIVDTFVVRSVVVPALVGLLGDGMWWPRRNVTKAQPADSQPAVDQAENSHPAAL